jgi:hypothetical protein
MHRTTDRRLDAKYEELLSRWFVGAAGRICIPTNNSAGTACARLAPE